MRAALLGPVEGKISCQSMQHIFLTTKMATSSVSRGIHKRWHFFGCS
jgi:hypothetical protein